MLSIFSIGKVSWLSILSNGIYLRLKFCSLSPYHSIVQFILTLCVCVCVYMLPQHIQHRLFCFFFPIFTVYKFLHSLRFSFHSSDISWSLLIFLIRLPLLVLHLIVVVVDDVDIVVGAIFSFCSFSEANWCCRQPFPYPFSPRNVFIAWTTLCFSSPNEIDESRFTTEQINISPIGVVYIRSTFQTAFNISRSSFGLEPFFSLSFRYKCVSIYFHSLSHESMRLVKH